MCKFHQNVSQTNTHGAVDLSNGMICIFLDSFVQCYTDGFLVLVCFLCGSGLLELGKPG